MINFLEIKHKFEEILFVVIVYIDDRSISNGINNIIFVRMLFEWIDNYMIEIENLMRKKVELMEVKV